ncbi:MAG: nuclear transport factor 2 family protein [Ignavibacterium sp.]|nr:MAG: nuclear transport factor 2 family protein [Ignavibacterium sp.]
MKYLLFVLFLFLLLTGLSSAQEWTAEQKEVWAGVQKYWEIDESDRLAFLEYFDDSYLGWSYDTEAPGTRDDVVKSFTYWSKKGKPQFNNLTPARIWVNGNFAFVHYYYTQVVERADGTPRQEKGRWTDILMKKGGKWMIVGDHGGEIKK